VEQSFEHGVEVIRGSEDPLDTSASATRADDGEVARPSVAETVAIDNECYSRGEVRVPDDELPARAQLDDDLVACGRLVTHLAQSRYPRV
jgi:hypothetical protein